MHQQLCRVLQNAALTDAVWQMRLEADTASITAPGQFVELKLPGFYIRRPISICDWDGESLTLLYKVVGKGTDAMTRIRPGHRLDTLVGMGNGYDLTKSGDAPLLIGGGVGVPPLYGLCKALLRQGKHPAVILGFNTKDEIFYEAAFRALGVPVHITTVDGSCGTKGFVTDVMKDLSYTYFYTCGPGPMFRAIEKTAQTSGQYSFEERMGCGFGACMGCSIETKLGARRVCKDWPVFEREAILW